MSLLRRSNGSHASISVSRPLARSNDLVIEELDGEVLVYDRTNKRAHCLTATAARVWRACDGQTDTDGIADLLELSSEAVRDALSELERTELLEISSIQVLQNGNGHAMTRRELTKRSAQVGTAVAAAPLILSITAPTAMAAISPPPFVCQLYTTKDCGCSSGCGAVAGCCCCDTGCSDQGSCKVCSAVGFCNLGKQECANQKQQASKCSDECGHLPPNPGGCCSVSFPAPTGCGCNWGPQASCCDPTQPQNGVAGPPFKPCTSTTNCVPCCNGYPITTATVAKVTTYPTFGCCTNGSTGDVCAPTSLVP